MSYHACVWIDQRQAKVFAIDATRVDRLTLEDLRPRHHLHGKRERASSSPIEIDHSMLDAVGKTLGRARAILIVGPGHARTVLAGYLNEHFPDVARRIWNIRSSDHPTDAQVVASAREYFHTADRVH